MGFYGTKRQSLIELEDRSQTRVRKMILSFAENENLPRTFLTLRQRIEAQFPKKCPARIYPFAGHLKISSDMSGETGGFHVLWVQGTIILP